MSDVKIKTLAALLATTVVSGCSSIPDALNPVEWYNDTVEYFTEDDDEQVAEAQAGENKGLVGDKEGAERARIAAAKRAESDEARSAGLVGDRNGRRYASAPIPRQDEAPETAAVPVIGAPVTMAATQPAPPASPATPVARNQLGSSGQAAPAPAGNTVGQTFKLKLAQKFQPSAGAQPQPGTFAFPKRPGAVTGGPANAQVAQVGDPLATVVISSDGVLSEGAMSLPGAAAPAAQGKGAGSPMFGPAVTGPLARPSAHAVPRSGPVKVATILFGNGSINISAEDRKILAQVIRLQKKRGGTIRVVGHASSRTRNMDLVRHKMVNFKVSADRADAVAQALMKLGLSADNISVVARSDAEPLYYEIMPSGEAGNRRAEIYLDS